MFYDLDILNRRGGKFGVIWLAAHQRLKYEGQGKTRGDQRLALNVNIGRTVKEILEYVRVQRPPTSPNEPSPRFSLYLSAMLTHGAILIHHFQVKHDVAHVKLAFDMKPKPKKQSKDINYQPNKDAASSSAANEDQLVDQPSHGASQTDFGHVLIPTARASQVYSDESGFVREFQLLPLDGQDAMRDDPRTLAQLFEDVRNDPRGHLTTNDKITLKEPEPIPRPIIEEEENFGLPGDVFDFMEDVMVPENMEVDPFNSQLSAQQEDQIAASPRRPTGLTRSNSKRGREDTSDHETTPSKVRRPPARDESPIPMDAAAPPVQPEPIEVDPVPVEQMELLDLQPRDVAPGGQRVGGRRRPRRLVLDEEAQLSPAQMRNMREDFADTLRVPNVDDDTVTHPRDRKVTAKELFDAPNIRTSSTPLANLCKPRFVRPTEQPADEDPPRMQDLREEDYAGEAAGLGVGDQVAGPAVGDLDALPRDQPESPRREVPEGDNMDTLPPMEPIYDMEADPELARPLSREASYAGSLHGASASVSRVDTSGLDRSQGSPPRAAQPERPTVLETVEEASVEVSQQSSQNKTAGRSFDTTLTGPAPPHRSFEPPPALPEENEILMDELEVPPLLLSPSAGVHGTPVPSPSQRESYDDGVLEIDQRYPSPRPLGKGGRGSQIDDPPMEEDDALIQQIENLTVECGGTLTFRQLVPPESNTRMRAAMVYEKLLRMASLGRLDLDQDEDWGPIYITLL